MPDGNTSDRRTARSDAKRALLEQRLRGGAGTGRGMALARRRSTAPPPLSFSQQRLWILDQLRPGSPAYNMPVAFRLRGPLDAAAMARALNEIIRRHEALRTTFRVIDGEPAQIIAPELTLALAVEDLTAHGSPDAIEAEAVRIAQAEAAQPFDLSRGPLFRARLLRLAPDHHVLLLTMHHIVSDGWSLGVLKREMNALYAAFVEGRPSPLDELPVQYADVTLWQRESLAGAKLEAQLAYWRQQLDGVAHLRMPLDRPRPAVQTFRGGAEVIELGPALSAAVDALGQHLKVTPFMTLLAAFNVLLFRYTGQTDLVVGSPIAGRTRSEAEALIGFFVNSLALRTRLDGAQTFNAVVAHVAGMAHDAFAHQDLPFERLVEDLQPERDLGQNPIFQVMFAVQNAPSEALDFAGLRFEPFLAGVHTTRFDLELHVMGQPGALRAVMIYNADLFERDTVRRLLDGYRTLIESVLAEPALPIARLRVLGERERQTMVERWNATGTQAPVAPAAPERVAAQARVRPDAPAVADRAQTLTYAQLDARANQIARLLQSHGVGPERKVAVLMERSAEMVAALLGVWKAGGAYVPLDPAYPEARIAFAVEDTGAPVLLTQARLASRLPATAAEVVRLDGDWKALAGVADGPVAPARGLDHLAYVIYTSGSTGRPKGVEITHRGLLNLVGWHQRLYEVTPADRATQVAGVGFDASVWELWPYLTAGASIHIPEPDAILDPAKLWQWLAAERVTLTFLPTPLAEAALRLPRPEGLALRALLTGGDRLTRAPERPLPFELINHYGPTESSVVSTCGRVAAGPSDTAPSIGRPIDNVTAYVLDRGGEPVPIGVEGELFVGGLSLARGYMGRPDLTAERFVPNPFAAEPGSRLYRTGDIVRYDAAGNIHFVGRTDLQVKIRGFRIELGEIDSVLLQHPAVTEAVTIAGGDGTHDEHLTTYLVADPWRVTTGEAVEQTWKGDHVSQWQTLYDETYGRTDAAADSGFNIIGWNSSYTGEPIPEAEMREWVESTVARILALKPRRILEIGCGTGLLLSRLAPHCDRYLATDFSAAAIAQVRRHCERRAVLAHVELSQRTADDFAGIDTRAFDVVVINSVIQYFPGADYLTRVLAGAAETVVAGGCMFVGDIRSFPLLTAYHASIRTHQAAATGSAAELRRVIARSVANEEELTIDPGLFEALREVAPRVTHVETLFKRGRAHNELTRFRYDALLHIERTPVRIDSAHVLEWQPGQTQIDDVRTLLDAARFDAIVVANVPNARVTTDVALLQALASPHAAPTVAELREQARRQNETAVDPEALWALGESGHYAVSLTDATPSGSGRMTAVFRRTDAPDASEPCLLPATAPRSERKAPAAYANDPLKAKRERELTRQLRAMAQERLPDYMVPGSFVVLDALPLSPSGKVDRRALAAWGDGAVRASSGGEGQTAYVPPVSDIERRIADVWKQVLGVERVGLHDNFFDLGGHSLRLIQVQQQLRDALGRDVSAVDLFRAPTVASLAALLGGTTTASPALAAAKERAARGRTARSTEPIAIIGLAGRFPGAATVDEFWSNLRDGVESIRRFTEDELREAGVPERVFKNPRYVPAYGFMADAELFDASFFGVAPREAEFMDPQQRIFLECAWEAIERAGYNPHGFTRPVGVYAGSSASSYAINLFSRPDLLAAAGGLQAVMGTASDFLATRTSYKLNLRGPSLSIQTACSTSMVAIHQACQGLLNHECDMALAGGATVRVPLVEGYTHQEEGIGSPDGHCRAFDAAARGTVGGSGTGVVVLKRLSDAVADGDHIHALILGTAINNDGAEKVGYTAPGVNGQAAAIAAAHAAAGVAADSISYVESHGTGTALGDPIEIDALTQVFRESTTAVGVCGIGSLKTNVGHLDAAAGVSGIIKTTMALERETLPPSLHFSSPNPKIPFGESPFFVNDRLRPWPRGAAPRRAGVSSFGIGGTNAHAVLEEAPPREPSGPSRPEQLLVISARTAAALERATADLAAWLEANPAVPLADVAYTLQVGRKRFAHRRATVATTAADAAAALRAADRRRVRTAPDAADLGAVAFMFTGQGAQARGMARGLYDAEAVFRAEVDRCAELLQPELGRDIRTLIFAPAEEAGPAGELLTQTLWSQPAVFVTDYALAKLWESWGVAPRALIGHSLGEYVAACVAGVLSLEDALTVVAARAKLMQSLPPGAMTAVSLDEADVAARLPETLAIAAANGPGATVVSGPLESIAAFEQALAAGGVASRRLATSHAFHSAMVDPILEPFAQVLRRVQLRAPQVPYVSNVSGTWITAAQATDPTYWVRHMREPVHFAAGVTTLLAEPELVLLEVGPGQSLTGLARRAAAGADRVMLASQPVKPDASADVRTMLDSLGALWLHGVAVDWAAFSAGERRHRVELPTYPFERQRFWIDAGRAPAQPAAGSLQKRSDVTDWFYLPSWTPTPVPDATVGAAAAPWIVFADALGVSSRLAASRRSKGDEVVVVTPGDRFARVADGEYTLPPGAAADYRALVREIVAAGDAPIRVLHAWSLTGPDHAREREHGFYSLLFLAQALAAEAPDRRVDIAVAGSGIHAVSGEDPVSAEKALVLGPCRVVPQEHPAISCRSIDLTPPGSAAWLLDRAARLLERELTSGARDLSVAYRGGQRYTGGFAPAPLPAQGGHQPLRENGVYVITGGFGRLGLVVAEHLAREVKARVALVSRSAPVEQASAPADPGDPRTQRFAAVQRIEALGGEVMTLPADVADAAQMAAALDRIEARWGAIHGVIHAAAITEADAMRAVLGLDAAQCERQFAPKAGGAAVLEQLLGDRPLDFCVLMSSISSVLGGLGFGAYAAANAWLDAFAHEHNRRHPVRWTSVAWDSWASSEADHAAHLSEVAALSMKPSEGLEALRRVLRTGGASDVIVSTADLDARVRRWVERPEAGEERPASVTLHDRPALANAFTAPRDAMEEALAGIWQALLGIDRIGVHDSFFDLGGHSLLALQLLSRVRDVFGAELSVHTVFNSPTVAQMADVIRGSGGAADDALQRLDAMLKLVEGLPDEELQSLLASSGMEESTS